MAVPIKLILKEIGSRINNIGTIVDTNPNNDETTSYAGKMLQRAGAGVGAGAFAGGIKDMNNMKDTADAASAASDAKDAAEAASAAKDMADAASAAKDVASAASDRNIKDITSTNTADVIEKAYKQLDDIIYKYNSKGQALGEDDKLRAGITAQSMEGSILESAVIKDPNTGYKMVDTRHLALANAAAIKEIFERLDRIEGRNEL